jgi:hypothetical protein
MRQSGRVSRHYRAWRRRCVTPRSRGVPGFIDPARAGSYGDYKDKSFDVKFLLLQEEGLWPSMALGGQDIFGTEVFRATYVTFGKKAGDFDFTLGYGHDEAGVNAYITIPLQQREFVPPIKEPEPYTQITPRPRLEQWNSDAEHRQHMIQALLKQDFKNVRIATESGSPDRGADQHADLGDEPGGRPRGADHRRAG